METSESGAGANHDKQPQSSRPEVRRNSEDDNGDTKQRAMETRSENCSHDALGLEKASSSGSVARGKLPGRKIKRRAKERSEYEEPETSSEYEDEEDDRYYEEHKLFAEFSDSEAGKQLVADRWEFYDNFAKWKRQRAVRKVKSDARADAKKSMNLLNLEPTRLTSAAASREKGKADARADARRSMNLLNLEPPMPAAASKRTFRIRRR